MPPQYIFPCPNCEHKFQLTLRQAGQDLKCPQCEQAVEAPKLGAMKNMELVAGTEQAVAGSASGGWRNTFFVAGLLAVVICGASGCGIYFYANQMVSQFDMDQDLEDFGAYIDELTPYQTVLSYQELEVEEGLGDWYEPNFMRYNRQAEILRPFAYGLMGVAGLGFLAMLASFCMKP